ncbi:hypothetical protein L207DRAFT_266970 [Hyaloscypha variabilis F]|uniref:C2H2-type domain-containing protein n=1 Tax=Hyaloscypha variabilis (strain UAMH 11265 / GT02V1 / F) TaxID=1149755 RepID=A0A2J6RZE6_HYAVF|nr:hypothetical protein L207DRAFT_266970 [Hyaloscypha variabilis F]
MLNSTTSSIGAQNLAPAEIEYPPTQSSDSMPSSVMSQSVTGSSPRKRGRLVSLSLAEPKKQYKPLIPSAVHRCKWATCSETLDCISKLRTHARTHAASQTICMWSGCLKISESIPDLRRHLDSHTKPYLCSMCQHQAATARDLSRHKLCHGFTSGSSVYYCPSPSCPYRQGGHKLPFGRRDNALRHINNRHPSSTDGPVPGIYQN